MRCPNCGELLPEMTATCPFCGENLTPSLEQSNHISEQPVEEGALGPEKDSSLRDSVPIQPGETPAKQDTSGPEPPLPAWLQSLRQEEKQTSIEAPTGTGPVPAPEEISVPNRVASSVSPDWLAGLRSSAEEEEEIPEWLVGIRSKNKQRTSALPSDETPDQSQGDDWLSRLDQSASKETKVPLPPEKPTQTPHEALPDWLSNLKEEAAQSAPPEEKTQAPAEVPPDWLSSQKEEATQSVPSEKITQESTESPPDWLSSLKEQAERSITTEEVPETTGKVFAPLESIGQTSLESEIPSTEVPGEPELLDQPQPESGAPAEKPAVKPFEAGSIPPVNDSSPDWLKKLQAEAAETNIDHNIKASTEPVIKGETPGESLPDWLSALKKEGSEAGIEPPLIQDGKTPPTQSEPAGILPIEEQPSWLSALKPEESKDLPSPEGETSETEEISPESLEKAELPAWVQAMRPMEAVVSEAMETPMESGRPSEQLGPLAGLQGVLPAVPGLGQLRKPPIYSEKLHIDESQQQHIQRLERIITRESEPRAIRTQGQIFSARLLRWVIALVLILAVGGTVLGNGQFVPSEAFYPSEMLPTINIISELPPSSPVLVVFDYQPALSGEMEAVAAPLIDQLLFSGARLTILSTSPTGPILAERFLQNTQREHNYQAGQQYVNLGFLSGGPAGVLAFAQNPQKAAPYNMDGQGAWQMPPLQGVQQLSDFAAVLVLTDDADNGRTWIEQTVPSLGPKPMLMAISAQAEPMIRPYYDSGQLKGLVSGLVGGKAYEQAIQQPGPAGMYWNAFSVGILAAEIMIIIGAIWNALSARDDRNHSSNLGSQP